MTTENQVPFFSVIMPVYNAENWLSDSVGCILAQTFTDWELICVNDGSTDNSQQLLEDYSAKDDRIKLIIQTNAGASVARNTGITAAKGHYIMFLDADDYFDSDALEIIKEGIEKTTADLLIISLRDVPQTSNFKQQQEIRRAELNTVYSLGEILAHTTWYTTDKVYKADVLRAANIKFSPLLTLAEDFHFWYSFVMQCSKVSMLRNQLYNHRVTPNSLSSRYLGRWQVCPLEELKININFFEELAALCDNVKNAENRRVFRRCLLMRAIDFHLLNVSKITSLKGHRKQEAIKLYHFPLSELTKDLSLADKLQALKCFFTTLFCKKIKSAILWRLRRN